MKRLAVLLSFVLLNGCALWDAYFMTGFDTNEYRIITEIRTDAGEYKTQCNDTAQSRINAESITRKTSLFENYSQEIPKNQNGINASRNLNEIARGLRDRYYAGGTVSPTFCKLKFESIEHSAQTIQHVVGQRPR